MRGRSIMAFCFLMLLICLQTGIAQETIDLEGYLQKYSEEKTDTGRVSLLTVLIEQYQKSEEDKADFFVAELIKLLPKITNEKIKADAYFKLLHIYHLIKPLDTVENYGLKALENYEKIDDKTGMANALYFLGKIPKEYHQNIEYYQQSLAIRTQNGEKCAILDCLFELSRNYYYIGQFDKALEYLNQSFDLAKSIQTTADSLKCSHTILALTPLAGDIFWNQGQYLKALDQFQKGLDLARRLNDEYLICVNTNRLGLIYQDLEYYDLAFKYHSEALSYSRTPKEMMVFPSYFLYDLGKLFQKKGELIEALKYYKEAQKLCKEYNPTFLPYPLSGIAEIYAQQDKREAAWQIINQLENTTNDFQVATLKERVKAQLLIKDQKWSNALTVALNAFEIAKNNKLLNYEYDLSILIQQIYTRQNDLKNALAFSIIRQEKSDSLTSKHNIIAAQRLALEYETEKKEAAILALKQEKELQISKYRNQQYLLVVILTMGICAILTTLFFYSYNQKNKALAEQEIKLRNTAQNLFANISHEFRTPLTIIRAPLEQLTKGEFHGNFQEIYSIMLKNTHRLTDLVNQILDLSRIQENRLRLNLEYNNPVDFIRTFVGQFSSYAEDKKVALKLQIPNYALSIHYDEEIWTKILNNLLSNAIKFTDKGEVLVTFQYSPKTIILTVKDTGKGIEEKYLPYIYDRYYRSPIDRNRVSSGGLGLSLVKQLVELCKGNIKVDSKLEEGTIFTIELPHQENFQIEELQKIEDVIELDFATGNNIHQENILPSFPMTPSISANLNYRNPNLKKILIVEDNLDLNNLIQNRLIQDYRVYQAFNGIEGYEVAKEITPDLIITDIMMPELDGLSLAKKLQASEATSHIPLIVVSALKGDVEKSKILETNALGFISKPIDFEQLIQKVSSIVTQREQFKQQIQKNNWIALEKEVQLVDRDKEFLEQFRKTLLINIADPDLSIERLSQLLFMSRVNLYRKIKSLTGLTPTNLMYKIKMQYAHELLRQHKGNISEVANQVGISNASFFSKKFKHIYGLSPTEFMRRN